MKSEWTNLCYILYTRVSQEGRSIFWEVIVSEERMHLSFTIAAGPHQRSHCQVRVPRDSWPHFTVSDSILPQPGGPDSRIYIPQEQGGLVIPPDTGFSFRRLLLLTGLRWRYSIPPPQEILIDSRLQLSWL
jgi:hypothetical protein